MTMMPSSSSFFEDIGKDLYETMQNVGDDVLDKLKEIGGGEIIPLIKSIKGIHLMEAFNDLKTKIMDLDTTLNNPLFIVSKDIQDLCALILEIDEYICSPDKIVTLALRNGPRDEPHLKMEEVKGQTFLKVEPNPSKGIWTSDSIDLLIEFVVDLYHPGGINRSPTLLNNFGPVREETKPIGELKVEGQIPETLNGMMIRNGPNPMFDPIAHYYWLDGDRTARYKQEQYHGKSQFIQYGDLHGEFGLFMVCMQLLKEKIGILDMSYGWSNANTGLVYHNEMLMILQDWDQPYLIDVQENGDLNTLGIYNCNKKLGHSVTPHPKKDTGELFVLGSSYTSPYAKISIISKNGDIRGPLEITTSGPNYMHDFGLTPQYVIIMDLPYRYNPKKMLDQGTWVYSFDMKKSRFGILSRKAENEDGIKWFEFDRSFTIFHNGNSWEEDEDTIVLVSLVLEPKITKAVEAKVENDNDKVYRVDNPFRTIVENIYEVVFKPPHLFAGRNTSESFTQAKLCKFTFNMRTGEAHQIKLSETHFEYPKINESYIGRKSKYLYLSELDGGAKIPSIVKFDLELKSETKLSFGTKTYGSEVVFVPRRAHISLEEDDGYLTTFGHDENKSKSFAYVICAKRMEFLAKIELPNRVPYGFHATFVPEDEFQKAI